MKIQILKYKHKYVYIYAYTKKNKDIIIYMCLCKKKCFDVCFKNAHGKSTEFRSKAEADYSFILPEEKTYLQCIVCIQCILYTCTFNSIHIYIYAHTDTFNRVK